MVKAYFLDKKEDEIIKKGPRNMSSNFEKLVQNVQKGEMYNVKFKNDPQVYLAIPMIPGRYQNEVPPKFILNVVAPKEYKGVSEHLLDEIEYLERNS